MGLLKDAQKLSADKTKSDTQKAFEWFSNPNTYNPVSVITGIIEAIGQVDWNEAFSNWGESLPHLIGRATAKNLEADPIKFLQSHKIDSPEKLSSLFSTISKGQFQLEQSTLTEINQALVKAYEQANPAPTNSLIKNGITPNQQVMNDPISEILNLLFSIFQF